jgi:hypothetical protein
MKISHLGDTRTDHAVKVEPHPAIARHEELMAVLDRIARALEAQVPGEYYGAVK